MNGWLKMTLGEIADIGSSKRIFAADYVDVGVPFYRSREIIEKANNSPVSTGLFITTEKFEGIKRKFGAPSQGDILLTSVGTLGIPYQVKNETFYFKDGNLIWLRNFRDEISPKFVYHWFRSYSAKAELLRYAIGVAQPAFTIEGVRKAEIKVPPQAIQLRIANILSAYDDLIENNTRRIKILEQMSQMLYREWFVNFRFPGHEKVKMVESELGKIPEGWTASNLGNLTSVITKGTTPTTLGKSFTSEGINFVKVECVSESGAILIGKLAKIDEQTHGLLKRSQLQQGDILFSIAGAIGRVALVRNRVLPANTNQALAIVRCSQPTIVPYVLSALRSFEFLDFSKGHVVQTAQANVSLSVLKSAPILLPPSTVVAEFHTHAQPLIDAIECYSATNENLRTTRDLLLPKLVSGEIGVENFEQEALAETA